MDEQQKEFLTVLGYFYLQNGRFEKAVVLLKALHFLFPEDIYIMSALCYADLKTERFEEALTLSDRFLAITNIPQQKTAGYLLKSKALYGMGKESEAREILHRYIFNMKDRP